MLAPSGTAIFANSDSRIEAAGCAIHVNSDSPGAVETNGVLSGITAQELYIAPGGTATGPGIPPVQSAPPLPDPLAYLQEPANANAPCVHTGWTIINDTPLDPDVYCDDLIIDNNSTVTFNKGTYIIRRGKFTVNSGSTIKTLAGQGVTFYIMEDAEVLLNSNSHAELEAAPLGEEFPGILFYQARTNSSKNIVLNSDSTSTLVGAIYYPNASVIVNSGSSIGGVAPFSSIVAQGIEVNSNSSITLNNNFSGSTVPDVPTLGAFKISLFE